jgi:hypothetical protein
MSNELSPLELRDRAIRELVLLFGIKTPTEEDILYMMGLYHIGADIVGLAIRRNFYLDRNCPPYPDDPGDDVSEEDLEAAGFFSINERARRR